MLAMLSAFDQMNLHLWNVREIFFQAGSEALDLIPAQRNVNLRHLRTSHKLSQRMNEDRHASKLSELLGRCGLLAFAAGIRDHTRPQTCSRNDHNYLHSGLQVYEGEGCSSNRIAECRLFPVRYSPYPHFAQCWELSFPPTPCCADHGKLSCSVSAYYMEPRK